MKIAKNKLTWINFLHIYQPINTDAHTIKEATDKSYWRIARALIEHPEIKFTLNISGCLFLRWKELGYQKLIEIFKKLSEKKQIEFTGSVAYHPLLPLIPKNEVVKQINENEKILKKYFGKNFFSKGFFLPEMAYSSSVAKIIKKHGYEWIILDEIAFDEKKQDKKLNNIYKDKASGLKVIFRSKKLSNTYVPKTVKKLLTTNKQKTIITGTDGELYGLRYLDQTAEFEKILNNKNLITKTISEFINEKELKEKIKKIKIRACNWESTEKELKEKKPYASWINKKNKIQNKLWDLANFAYKTLEKNKDDKNYYWARWHLVRGFASCSFWWASAKDFSYNYGPYAWNPDEIERGVNELIRAIRTLNNIKTRKTKIKAEKIYIKIEQLIWQNHWNYYWKINKT